MTRASLDFVTRLAYSPAALRAASRPDASSSKKSVRLRPSLPFRSAGAAEGCKRRWQPYTTWCSADGRKGNCSANGIQRHECCSPDGGLTLELGPKSLARKGEYNKLHRMPSGILLRLCVTPKCGTTRWTQLMQVVLSGRPSSFSDINGDKAYWLLDVDVDRIIPCERSWPPPPQKTLWILPVRNPYERLLSAYLDKVVRTPKFLGGRSFTNPMVNGGRLAANASAFSGFVHELTSRCYEDNTTATRLGKRCGLNLFGDMHILPLTRTRYHCTQQAIAALRADEATGPLVLRLEEQAAWYPALVARLGIREHVSHRAWRGGCWFKPAGTTCPDALLPPKAGYTRAMGRECIGTACSRDAKHETGAVSKLHTFYSPREAAMVTEFFREDLRMFDYPEWRAAPGTVPWLA